MYCALRGEEESACGYEAGRRVLYPPRLVFYPDVHSLLNPIGTTPHAHLQIWSTAEQSHHSRLYFSLELASSLCVFLLFGACDGHRIYAHLQILSPSETINHSMYSFSLELATGCATPPSQYYLHSVWSTTLCLPSLWSLRQAALFQPPNIVHI